MEWGSVLPNPYFRDCAVIAQYHCLLAQDRSTAKQRYEVSPLKKQQTWQEASQSATTCPLPPSFANPAILHSEPQRRVRVRNPPKPKFPIPSSFPCLCCPLPRRTALSEEGGHMETTRKARGSFLCTAAGVFHAEISWLLRVRRGPVRRARP